MGCLNVIIDSDIIFLLVSILRPSLFQSSQDCPNGVFISQEIEEEIEDPVSSSLKEKLLKEGVWEYFSPSGLQQAKKKSWANINGRVRSILLASLSLPRSLRERRDIIKGVFYFFGQDYVKECQQNRPDPQF